MSDQSKEVVINKMDELYDLVHQTSLVFVIEPLKNFVEKYGVINKGCGCARKKRVRVAAEAYETLAQHLHANPHLGDEVLRLAKTYRVVLNHEGTELCQLGIHREQEE